MTRILSIALLAVGLTWSFATRPADELNWRSHGWSNVLDHVLASTWDPADTTYRSMYAVGPGGIYHSADMGVSWTHRDSGMDNLMVSHLAIARNAPDILYATTGAILHRYPEEQPHVLPGNGIYRSGDRGQSWERLPLAIDEPDMKFLNTVVTSPRGDTVVVASHRRILRSMDHGQTWQEVHRLQELYGRWDITGCCLSTHFSPHLELFTSPYDFSSLIAIRRDIPRAYGVDLRYDVLHSLDGGATWHDLEINGQTLRQLADEHPSAKYGPPWPFYTVDPGVLWAFGRGKAFRSEDYGRSWDAIPVVDPDSFSSVGGVGHPLRSSQFLTPGLVWTYEDGVITGKRDGTGGTGGYWGSHAQPLREPNLDGFDYRGFGFGGSVLKVPYGQTSAFNNAQVKDICKLAQTGSGDRGNYRYLGLTGKNGPMVGSTSSRIDADWHYERHDESHMRVRAALAEWVLCHPTKPHHALVEMYSGDYLRSATSAAERDTWVYHHDRTDGAVDAWTTPQVRTHIGYEVYAMDTTPALQDTVYAVTMKGVFRSDDWADTWTQLLGEPDVNSSAGGKFIHVSRADPNHIITQRAVSRDGGETWEDLQYRQGGWEPHYDWVEQERTIFRTYGYHLGPGNPHDTRHEFPWQLPGWIKMATHPGAPDYIWTCTPLEIRRWTEDLTSYTTLATAEDLGVCRDILVMDSDPNWFWVGTDRGIWESLDGGDTWHPASRGLPPVPVSSFDVAEGQVIVGTLGRGVFSVLQAEVEALRTSSERKTLLPDRLPFALTPTWPNPFSSSTTVGFRTEETAPVRIEVYDVTGRKVSVLTDRVYTPGRHSVDWQAEPQSSGVYFVRMLADGRQVDTRRMVLRK